MVNDLVRIVNDTESSLAAQPAQYSTQLELFVAKDEKVLAEFLRQERDDKPHYLRHQDWEILVAKPLKYKQPKKYMEGQKKEFPEVEKQMKDLIARDGFSRIGVGQETIAIFGDMPSMLYRVFEMETKVYESVVAYAKQISSERNVKLVDVVKSQEGRDEIYRRTFGTKEQFEWYNNTKTECNIIALGAMYEMIDAMAPEIEEAKKVPIVGWLFRRKMDKMLKKFPPKVIAKSFMKEDINYNRNHAERIYSTDVDDIKYVDAVIVN